MRFRLPLLWRFDLDQGIGPIHGLAQEGVTGADGQGENGCAKNQVTCIEQHVHEAWQVDFLVFPDIRPWVVEGRDWGAYRMMFVGNDDRRFVHGSTVQRVMARVVYTAS